MVFFVGANVLMMGEDLGNFHNISHQVYSNDNKHLPFPIGNIIIQQTNLLFPSAMSL